MFYHFQCISVLSPWLSLFLGILFVGCYCKWSCVSNFLFGLCFLSIWKQTNFWYWFSMFWRRQWHPTPVLLPGESHGRRSLVGCSPWGLGVGHDWATSLSLLCIGEGNGNPLQCSCLENPRDGGAWWAAVYGVAQSQTRLKWHSSSMFYVCWVCFLVLLFVESSEFLNIDDFTWYKIILSMNRNNFTSSFLIWMLFISFSFFLFAQLLWLKLPIAHWIELMKVDIFLLLLISGEKFFNFLVFHHL